LAHLLRWTGDVCHGVPVEVAASKGNPVVSPLGGGGIYVCHTVFTLQLCPAVHHLIAGSHHRGCLIGVAITLGVWDGFGQNDPLAIGALVLATISYGIGGPYIRKFVTPMNLSGISSAAAQVSTSAITLLPFYLFSGPLITSSPSIESLLSIIALGVLGSGYAYRLYHDVIKDAGSTVASTVTFTNPVVATIWGILLLSEELHWYEPIGGVVVILGAWLAQHKATK
jgi:drug/metabolite transporter (DMT)-like permease